MLVLIFKMLTIAHLSAQTEYLLMARKAAFEDKNYPAAIGLSRQVLFQSPGYTDTPIFLGQVYFWSGRTDNAMLILKAAHINKASYEDASIALADIKYFNEHYSNTLYFTDSGLSYNRSSKELMLRKANALQH